MSESPKTPRPAAGPDPVRVARLRRGKQIKARRDQRERDNLLNALCGLPETATPATVLPPERLGQTVAALMGALHSRQPRLEHTIAAHWADIVGDAKKAHRCAVQRLADDGSLIVIAPGAVLRNELQFEKAKMLQRVRALPGCGGIRAIVLRAG